VKYSLSYLLLLSIANSSFGIVYVDSSATGNNDGSSWTNAYTGFQSALDDAGTEIWVAQGTYFPTSAAIDASTDPRNKAFHLARDKQIYGGFPNGGGTISDRNIALYPTILSGDFNQDDLVSRNGASLTFSNNTENALHVMITANLSNNTIIDGFNFIGGNANKSSSFSFERTYRNNYGAALYNSYSSPTISHCNFKYNTSTYSGGAIYHYTSSATYTNCIFEHNASDYKGGAMYNNYAPTSLTNCVFYANSAKTSGGAIHNRSSSPTIDGCTFLENYSFDVGGTISNHFSGNILISNSIFWNNDAPTFPVIYNYFSSTFFDHNLIEGSNEDEFWLNLQGISGEGNLANDPLFVNEINPAGTDGIFGTADDGLTLSSCSPAINVGTTSSNSNDILGNTRIANTIVDMGAYEYQASQYGHTYSNRQISTCGSYTTPSGKVWTTSKTENDTIPNAVGCDSIITIDFSVHQKSTSSIQISSCDSYTTPSGKVWTASKTENDTITNTVGCDSIITINLILHKSSHHTIDTIIACKKEYISPSGEMLSSTGSYSYYLINHHGCDSIVHINLFVEEASNCRIYMDEAFSPNGDGEHDVWVIHNYDPIDYPYSRIQIFNRLGAIVLGESPYQNAWNGTFGKSAKKAAIGTYFYLLDLGDGSDPIKGFIYLNR